MFVKPFRYERASSVTEACALLREYDGEAKVIAGGQSLLPMINLGLVDPSAVVDISRIAGLDGVAERNGSLDVGALTRHRALEGDALVARHQPLLAEAVRSVGNTRVRNRGTLGGSLAHGDPAAELPLAMTVLEAEYEVSNGNATRTIAAGEFPLTYFTTQLAEDELLTGVRVPKLPAGWGWGFHEVSRRPGDFAVVAAAAVVRCRGGAIEDARVGLAGVSERPVRLTSVEAALAGVPVSQIEDVVGEVDAIEPITDTMASAGYRRRLARVLARRVLADACQRSEGAD